MTSNSSIDPSAEEWGRISAATSLVSSVSRYVTDLRHLSGEQMPAWLTGLEVPGGWRRAQLENGPAKALRICVCGPQPDGGWDGCETIAAWEYRGAISSKMLRENANWTLHDLGAVEIGSVPLVVSRTDRVAAIRCTGYFAAGGLWIWAQHSYFAGATSVPGGGLLVQQSVFVESSRCDALRPDVAIFGNSLLDAFVSAVS
jgi:hypothetical protein